MPGATRWYPTNAARQRAYRQRQRQELAAEQEEATLTTQYAYVMQAAVTAALRAGAGDPLAREVHRTDPFETLRALAEHFYDQAGTPADQRPWR